MQIHPRKGEITAEEVKGIIKDFLEKNLSANVNYLASKVIKIDHGSWGDLSQLIKQFLKDLTSLLDTMMTTTAAPEAKVKNYRLVSITATPCADYETNSYVLSYSKGIPLRFMGGDQRDLFDFIKSVSLAAFKSAPLSYKYKEGDRTFFAVKYTGTGAYSKKFRNTVSFLT